MPEWARTHSWELLLGAILLATVVYNATNSPVYLDVDNFVNLFRLSIEKVIIAVAMTFVIINGEIDLSVASVMAFSACVLAAAHEAGVPFPLAIVLALAAAAAAGFVQGLVVARTGISSLVVTLAGLIGFRGAARILLEDRSIGDFPEWFGNVGREDFLGPMPVSLVLFLVMLGRGRCRPPPERLRAQGLRDRQQRRGGPVLGHRRRPRQADDLHDVRPGGRHRGRVLRRPPRARCGPTSARASSSTSSRWSCSAA